MKILITLALLLVGAPVTVMCEQRGSEGGGTPIPPGVTTEGPVPTTTPGAVNDTPSPTQAGTFVEPAKFLNLSMLLSGVTTLSESSWLAFEETYKMFNNAFYTANPQFGVTDIDILLEFVSQDPPARRRLGERQLQDDTLTLVYNQAIAYKVTPDSGLTQADVVTQPFATQTSRDAFAALLRNSDDAAFANIDTVSGLSQALVPSAAVAPVEGTTLAPIDDATTVIDTPPATTQSDGSVEPATTSTLSVAGTTPPSVTKSTVASVSGGATTVTTLPLGNASDCTTETSALNVDTSIQTEYSNIASAIETDAANDFLGFCNLLELSCEIDANNYSSNLKSACVAAGGQVTTRSLSFACSGTLGAIPVPEGLEIIIANWPVCVGNSCELGDLPQEIEQQIDATVNGAVDQIEAGLGGGVMCESLGGSETATTVPPPPVVPSTTPAPVDTADTTLAPVMPPTMEPPTSSGCSLTAFGIMTIGAVASLAIGAQ